LSRIIGYYRVSTEEQNLDMQERAIQNYADQKGFELVLYVKNESSRMNVRAELINFNESGHKK